MNGPTHGRIVAVNGPLVTCEVDEEREVLQNEVAYVTVSYTHLRAHETPEHLVCRLLLEKKKTEHKQRTTPATVLLEATIKIINKSHT